MLLGLFAFFRINRVFQHAPGVECIHMFSFLVASELDHIIPAEISGDKFYTALNLLAGKEDVSNILEIGSSSGRGSTQALVEGLKHKQQFNSISLFTIEVSKQRHEELSNYYLDIPFIHCYHGSSVSVNELPSTSQVEYFYDNISCGLQKYSKQEVLRWLSQDIQYLVDHGHDKDDCISRIRSDHKIDNFDLVLIDGSEFSGIIELNKVMGAKYIALDDTNTYKCYEARKVLLEHPCYQLIEEDQALRNGYSIFMLYKEPYGNKLLEKRYPEIHFFTIVLNGMPYIRDHIEAIKNLPIKWHWHIVEGVAELVNDTAWSLPTGGKVPEGFHKNGYSIDGTYEYLNELVNLFPSNITLYRKPEGIFWHGKKEMVEAPLGVLPDDCLLWQLDSDEIWTSYQILTLWRAFIIDPSRTAAWFWCNYFVGINLYITSRYCYAQNPNQEWLRVWRYRKGDKWLAHEPPQLSRHVNDLYCDIGRINPFNHDETESLGLVFNHYAYCTPEQVKFKEVYYGYTNALSNWQELQLAAVPCRLSNYLPWVTDNAVADVFKKTESINSADLPSISSELLASTDKAGRKPLILIDCVAWQLVKGGILRYWQDILEDIVNMGYGDSFIMIDRENTSPLIPGISRITVKKFSFDDLLGDSLMLEAACEKYSCNLFLSTYYTTPVRTPSYFVGYDMIPEAIGSDISVGSYLQKQLAILYSCRQICISQNSLADLVSSFPDKKISTPNISIQPRIAKAYFEQDCSIVSTKNIAPLIKLDNPYVLYVGERVGLEGVYGGYKNALSLAKAFRCLSKNLNISLVFAGGRAKIEDILTAELDGCNYHHVMPSDSELSCLYSNALCTIVSSTYEGFGIPIIESQVCGTPVVCSSNSSLGEAAGNGAFFVAAPTPTNLEYAIKCIYFNQNLREHLSELGLINSMRFKAPNSANFLVEDIFDILHKGAAANPPLYYPGMAQIASIRARLLNTLSPTIASSCPNIVFNGWALPQNPDFSIITPANNAAATLARCLKSVEKQIDVIAEHIIVDNGSTDSTSQIVKEYARFCTFISEPDSGIYDAMNKGIERASGKFLLFLGADDVLASPSCLSEALKHIRLDESYDFYYGNLLVDEGSSTILHTPPPGGLALKEMIFSCLPHQSMIIPKQTFVKYGLYDDSYKLHGDYEWMIRVLTAKNAKVKKIELTISCFSSGGASTTRFREGQAEVLAIQKSNKKLNSPYWLKYRAERGFEILTQLRANHS